MKSIKKIVAVCLSAVLMLGLVVSASAATLTGTPREVSVDNIYKLAMSNNPTIIANGYEETKWGRTGMDNVEYSQLVYQYKVTDKQIANGAVILLLTYYNVENQYAQLLNSQKTLNNNLKMADKMLALGLMSKADHNSLKQNSMTMDANVLTLENTLAGLRTQIASTLNFRIDEFVIAEFELLPKDELEELEKKIKRTSPEKVKNNSETAKLLALQAGNKNTYFEEDPIIASAQLQAYVSELERTFVTLRNDTLLKLQLYYEAEKSYQIKLNELEITKKQYDLGTISKSTYEDAVRATENEEGSILSAYIDFYTSYRKFHMLTEEGIIIQ